MDYGKERASYSRADLLGVVAVACGSRVIVSISKRLCPRLVPAFLAHECLFPFPQAPANCSFSEAEESSSRPLFSFLKITFLLFPIQD
jgi:hypothetical protein